MTTQSHFIKSFKMSMAISASVSAGEELERVLKATLSFKRHHEEAIKAEKEATLLRDEARAKLSSWHVEFDHVLRYEYSNAEKLEKLREDHDRLRAEYDQTVQHLYWKKVNVRGLKMGLEIREDKLLPAARANKRKADEEAEEKERRVRARAVVEWPDLYLSGCESVEEVDFHGDEFKNWMCSIGCANDLWSL